jgi:NAD(P)H-flavin reductase
VLIAGGTGLAPLKALAEQAIGESTTSTPRRIHLFTGVGTGRELYDIDSLQEMEAGYPGLTVVATIADESPPGGLLTEVPPTARVEHGHVGEVALRQGSWEEHDVYLCGSDIMVQATEQLLRDEGHPAERIFYEGFQSLGGDTYGVIGAGGR